MLVQDMPNPVAQSLACQSASLHHTLQLALCAGHMRAVHSMSQKRTTRHLEHVLSLREAPQPTQHADVPSRLPASVARCSTAALSPRRTARLSSCTASRISWSATAGALPCEGQVVAPSTHLQTSADGTDSVSACSAGALSSCHHLVATIAVQGVGGAPCHTIPYQE
jgi:hypothetical protein